MLMVCFFLSLSLSFFFLAILKSNDKRICVIYLTCKSLSH
jgi:hypothetical protein